MVNIVRWTNPTDATIVTKWSAKTTPAPRTITTAALSSVPLRSPLDTPRVSGITPPTFIDQPNHPKIESIMSLI